MSVATTTMAWPNQRRAQARNGGEADHGDHDAGLVRWRCTRLCAHGFHTREMTERSVTRGFVGRRTPAAAGDSRDRIPPGQYLTRDFPVLSAGPTPRTTLDRWSFSIDGLVRQPVTWTWHDLIVLPRREWVVDISCVTKWTKL